MGVLVGCSDPNRRTLEVQVLIAGMLVDEEQPAASRGDDLLFHSHGSYVVWRPNLKDPRVRELIASLEPGKLFFFFCDPRPNIYGVDPISLKGGSVVFTATGVMVDGNRLTSVAMDRASMRAADRTSIE
ncbi:MAG: hypothetical protein Q8P33_02350 [bacterium]|nr:hypothetical protein [bacterium]